MISFLKIFTCLFLFIFLNSQSISAQHLVGVKRNSIAQNYKLTSNSNQRFEGYTQKQIDREEQRNKRDQQEAKKQLLASHIKKQSKPVQKRMKAHLKMINKESKIRQIFNRLVFNNKRRKILSQRKENKYEY